MVVPSSAVVVMHPFVVMSHVGGLGSLSMSIFVSCSSIYISFISVSTHSVSVGPYSAGVSSATLTVTIVFTLHLSIVSISSVPSRVYVVLSYPLSSTEPVNNIVPSCSTRIYIPSDTSSVMFVPTSKPVTPTSVPISVSCGFCSVIISSIVVHVCIVPPIIVVSIQTS